MLHQQLVQFGESVMFNPGGDIVPASATEVSDSQGGSESSSCECCWTLSFLHVQAAGRSNRRCEMSASCEPPWGHEACNVQVVYPSSAEHDHELDNEFERLAGRWKPLWSVLGHLA